MAYGPGIGRTVQRKPYIIVGTATTTGTPVDLTFSKDGDTHVNYFALQNKDGTNQLLFSFDGVTYATIFSGSAFQLNAKIFTIWVKSSAATADYEFVCTADRS